MPNKRVPLAWWKAASATLTLLALALPMLAGPRPMGPETNRRVAPPLTGYDPVLDRADYPTGIAMTLDGTTLYVTAAKSRNVTVVDVASRQILQVIDPTQGGTVDVGVEKIAITPDGKWAVINHPVTRPEFSGGVSLVRVQDNRVVNTVTFPNSSTDQPQVSTDSRTAYVAGTWPPRIFAVDIPSGTMTATLDLSPPAINLWTHVIALSPDGRTLYAVGPYGLPDGSPSGYSRLVLVDTAPAWDTLAVNALFYASEVLIPVALEVLALQGIIEFTRSVSSLQKYHPSLSLRYVLPTFMDRRVKKSAEILTQLQEHFADLVCDPIRYNVRLSEAPGHGLTIFEYAPRSAGAQDYQRLTERILQDGGS